MIVEVMFLMVRYFVCIIIYLFSKELYVGWWWVFVRRDKYIRRCMFILYWKYIFIKFKVLIKMDVLKMKKKKVF